MSLASCSAASASSARISTRAAMSAPAGFLMAVEAELSMIALARPSSSSAPCRSGRASPSEAADPHQATRLDVASRLDRRIAQDRATTRERGTPPARTPQRDRCDAPGDGLREPPITRILGVNAGGALAAGRPLRRQRAAPAAAAGAFRHVPTHRRRHELGHRPIQPRRPRSIAPLSTRSGCATAAQPR